MGRWDKLEQEYKRIQLRLMYRPGVLVIYALLEKKNTMVRLYVLAKPGGNRGTRIVQGREVYSSLNDEDLSLCGETIAGILKDLHFRSKVGYISSSDSVTYYIRPDWDFWYGKKK